MSHCKALTIKEPWISLIVAGSKTIETRTWITKYRGPLLLTASQSPKTDLSGHAVAIANLYDCRPMTALDEAAACCSLYPLAYSWILTDIVPLQPYPIKGALSLFDVFLPHDTKTKSGDCLGNHQFSDTYLPLFCHDIAMGEYNAFLQLAASSLATNNLILSHLNRAVIFETKSAMWYLERVDCEPTRSIRFRSAATLALLANDYEAAQRLARIGETALTPPDLRPELAAVFSEAQENLKNSLGI